MYLWKVKWYYQVALDTPGPSYSNSSDEKIFKTKSAALKFIAKNNLNVTPKKVEVKD